MYITGFFRIPIKVVADEENPKLTFYLGEKYFSKKPIISNVALNTPHPLLIKGQKIVYLK